MELEFKIIAVTVGLQDIHFKHLHITLENPYVYILYVYYLITKLYFAREVVSNIRWTLASKKVICPFKDLNKLSASLGYPNKRIKYYIVTYLRDIVLSVEIQSSDTYHKTTVKIKKRRQSL